MFFIIYRNAPLLFVYMREVHINKQIFFLYSVKVTTYNSSAPLDIKTITSKNSIIIIFLLYIN